MTDTIERARLPIKPHFNNREHSVVCRLIALLEHDRDRTEDARLKDGLSMAIGIARKFLDAAE